MKAEKALSRSVAALLILAPLPFGSVETRTSAMLTCVALVVGAFWVLARSRRGASPLPWRDPVLAGGLCLAGVAFLQLIPLPAPALDAVSPEASALRREFEPGPEVVRELGLPGESGSGWRPLSMYPWATRHSLLRFLAFLLLALAVIDLSAGPARWREIAVALALSGGFQAVYGLVEFLSGRQHIFGYAKKYYTNVATGTFINRNHYAGFLELTLPFILALAVGAFLARPGAETRRERFLRLASGKDSFVGILWWLLAVVAGTALLCSRSRMGITSALLALAIVVIGLARKRAGRGFAMASGALLGVLFVLFSQGTVSPLLPRFLQAPAEFVGGVGGCWLWRQGAGLAATFPILGSGWGSFSLVFPIFRETGEGMRISHAHNDYLEFAATSGLFGVAVLAIAAAVLLRILLRRGPSRPGFGTFGYAAVAALVALAFHSITDFNLAIPANGLAVAVVTGLAVAWRRGGVPAPVPARAAAPSRASWPAVLTCAAILVLAAAAAAPALPGDSGSGESATSRSALPEAGGWPGWAAAWVGFLDPGNAERLDDRAQALAGDATEDLRALMQAAGSGIQLSPEALHYLKRKLGRAGDVQVRALRKVPTFPGGHARLGRIVASVCALEALEGNPPSGCLETASSQFHAAARIEPMSAYTHRQAGRFLIGSWPLLTARQRERARPLIERAVRMEGNRSLLEQWREIVSTEGSAPDAG